jgi:hypothetical protein
MTIFHPLLTEIFQEWNRRNLRWALLRHPAIPLAPAGDVDLLIHPGDLDTAGLTLAQHGFSSLPRIGYAPDRFYLAYHRPTGHWLWLHLTTDIAFGPQQRYRTDAASACLERRRASSTLSPPAEHWQESPLFLLDPDDAFWLLLLHCLLDKGVIAHRHRAGLRDLSGHPPRNGPFLPLLSAVIPPESSPDAIVTWARRERWESIEMLAPAIEARWRQRYPVAVQWLAARRAGRLLTRCLNACYPVLWRRYVHRARARRRSSIAAEGPS